MSAYVVLTHAERVMFRAILGIDEADKLMKFAKLPSNVYHSVAENCFIYDRRGLAVDAFRRGFRSFLAIDSLKGQPFRGCEAFDKLIAIDPDNQSHILTQQSAQNIFNRANVVPVCNLSARDNTPHFEVMAEWQQMEADTTYATAFMRFVDGTALRQRR